MSDAQNPISWREWLLAASQIALQFRRTITVETIAMFHRQWHENRSPENAVYWMIGVHL